MFGGVGCLVVSIVWWSQWFSGVSGLVVSVVWLFGSVGCLVVLVVSWCQLSWYIQVLVSWQARCRNTFRFGLLGAQQLGQAGVIYSN